MGVFSIDGLPIAHLVVIAGDAEWMVDSGVLVTHRHVALHSRQQQQPARQQLQQQVVIQFDKSFLNKS